MKLSEMKCSPVDRTVQPMDGADALKRAGDIPGWIVNDGAISREFTFKDFAEAMLFVNRVADLASAEDHHPDMHVSYNRVTLDLSTHKIGGLSMNDFILAAKINTL
jgi:4a-hydroxytetrahydrobiopterin dehydratase